MEQKDTDSQYRYEHIDIEDVIKNPTEYIIPECLPVCQRLWDNNIETDMCSNYDYDTHLWVTFDLISKENVDMFYELMEKDPVHYYIDGRFHKHGVRANSTEELLDLIQFFLIQDVKPIRYQSAAQFLENYKSFHQNNPEDMKELDRLYGDQENDTEIEKTNEEEEDDMTSLLKEIEGGDVYHSMGGSFPKYLDFTSDGAIIIRKEYSLNPKKANATFEEALIAEGKENLYLKDEDRVYSSPLFLKWHLKYLKSLVEKLDDYDVKNENSEQPTL